MSEQPARAAADAYAELGRLLDELESAGLADTIPPELVQRIFTMAVRNYSRCYEEDPSLPPLLEQGINATDVANSCLEMLRVADLQLFELTFWGGRLGSSPS